MPQNEKPRLRKNLMDNTHLALIAGTPHDFSQPEIDKAVADRFVQIKDGYKRKGGDRVYGGNRCLPECLGWRFRQNVCGLSNPLPKDLTPDNINAGKFDEKIFTTYEEAASSEHWYKYEKDWGWDDYEE